MADKKPKETAAIEPSRPVEGAFDQDPRQDIREGNIELRKGVTTDAPKQDDQQAAVTGDADHEDSPVRTSRPDVPIAESLAAGAGQHRVPDPDLFDRDGRFRVNTEEGPQVATAFQDEKVTREQQAAADDREAREKA